MVRGSAGNGWAGLDDFEFYHDQVDCPTLPENAKPPPPPTTEPPPGLYFQFSNIFWGWSDFRKPPPLVFCSSNIDFYSLICKYYCSIFHSHTASLLLCIEKRHKRRTEEKEFEVSFLRRTDFCKENLMNFVLKGA